MGNMALGGKSGISIFLGYICCKISIWGLSIQRPQVRFLPEELDLLGENPRLSFKQLKSV